MLARTRRLHKEAFRLGAERFTCPDPKLTCGISSLSRLSCPSSMLRSARRGSASKIKLFSRSGPAQMGLSPTARQPYIDCNPKNPKGTEDEFASGVGRCSVGTGEWQKIVHSSMRSSTTLQPGCIALCFRTRQRSHRNIRVNSTHRLRNQRPH